MTAPNIAALSNIIGTTSPLVLTTTATIVTATIVSQVLKINSVLASNVTNSNASVNLSLVRGGVTYYFAYNIVVPTQSTMVLIGKDTPFYMQESDQLQAFASAGNSIHLIASYEVIS